ncbi:hypothetical protein Leryth_012088 [Lithospermum erythrorhizon]|nr:hypothetical protein Leryth_012088 [Lithospermum erythrorhizon]
MCIHTCLHIMVLMFKFRYLLGCLMDKGHQKVSNSRNRKYRSDKRKLTKSQ